MIYIFMSIILSIINFIVCKKEFRNILNNKEYINIKEKDFKYIYYYPIFIGILFYIRGVNVFTMFIGGILPLLIMQTLIDIREKELSDIVTLTILINAILFLTTCFFVLKFPIRIIFQNIFTGIIMFLIYLAISLIGNNMGGGDVKLIGTLSVFFRYNNIPQLLMYPFLIGSVYGVFLIIFKKNKLNNFFAFAPFIILGFLITVCIY